MKQRIRIGFVCSLFVFLGDTYLAGQNFQLNGSASFLGGSCYQLTPDVSGQAGSIFSENPIDLNQPFAIDASFFFGCKNGNGADGIVFILSPSNLSLGGGGGGIGYQGITPSIGIEYDDYQNSNFGDPASDHMAIISMGNIDHTMPTNLAGPNNIANIEDCELHCFAVSWDPITRTLSATLDDNTITYTGDLVLSIFNGNPSVYYGFSSGTGGLSNIHEVCFGPPEVATMPDETICDGEDVQLEADPNGIAWTWAPDPTLSQLNISNPVATPDITTIYTTIIEYQCGYLGYDTVEVIVLPLPEAEVTNNGPACIGESIALEAFGGISYQWSGPQNFASGISDPTLNNVNTGNSGIYTVTVTDAEGCSSTSTTEVVIDEGPIIIIDDTGSPFCINIDPVQFTASPPGGEWNGEISVSGLFDPGYAGEGIHIISYTATNALGCTSTSQFSVEVISVADVVIDAPGVFCENGDPVQLSVSPQGGIWEGPVTLGGIFDPELAGLGTHQITYTVEDGNGCINSAQIMVEVVSAMNAEITPPGPFCGNDTITLFADPPGGMWGGVADANGQILPLTVNEGSHLITYQLNGSNACYDSEIYIDIIYGDVLSCPAGPSLCFNADPFLLVANPPGGTWSGAADVNGWVDPSTLSPGLHLAVYSDSILCGTFNSCWTQVEIIDAPTISNLSFTCDSLSTFYSVSFSILGGDTSSYLLTSAVNGMILPGIPYRFISDPIPAGNPYSFIITDENLCAQDTVAGIFECNCITNAGVLDIGFITACEDDIITIAPPTGVVLDPDDTLLYVLHLGFPDSILLVSDTNVFSYIPPLQPGATYYISTVAGNTGGGIGIDLSDPCLSVSFGTPVMWVANPTGFLSAPAQICNGDSAILSFTLLGSGPFDVIYTDGSTSYILDSIQTGHTIVIHPTAPTTYTLVSIATLNQPTCSDAPNTSIFLEVNENIFLSQSEVICAGDSLFAGGFFQKVTGTYIDSLTTQYGCDSIVQTILQVGLRDSTFLYSTTCDPSGTGVFTIVVADQTGCDSTIISTITYAESDTTNTQSYTCNFLEAGIFSTLFLDSGGCDSLVIETVEFVEADTTVLSGATCVPAEAGTWVTALTNSGGCDSIVIETILLLPSDTTFYQEISCFQQDVGIIEELFTNIFGCDSLIWTITELAPEDSCIVFQLEKDIFIPNIFSPNGDGQNDYFFVQNNEGSIKSIPLFSIFDRWGGLILERSDIQTNLPQQGWDGTYNGKPLSPGVYVWVARVQYTDDKMETLVGNVTLVR